MDENINHYYIPHLRCYAIDYCAYCIGLDETRIELEFENAKNHIYSECDLGIYSDFAGFDIEKAFLWIDESTLKYMKETGDYIETVLGVKRWLTPRSDVLDEYAIENQKLYINTRDFYDRERIELVSKKLGYDVNKANEWKSFNKIHLKVNSKNVEMLYFVKLQ